MRFTREAETMWLDDVTVTVTRCVTPGLVYLGIRRGEDFESCQVEMDFEAVMGTLEQYFPTQVPQEVMQQVMDSVMRVGIIHPCWQA